MEDNSNSNQEEESEIKEGDLLNIANNILSLLNYSQKLDNEDDLFLDDFYVSIIGNLLSENQPEIIPGKTLEEKAEIMNSLVQSLSEAIEVDLSHINGEEEYYKPGETVLFNKNQNKKKLVKKNNKDIEHDKHLIDIENENEEKTKIKWNKDLDLKLIEYYFENIKEDKSNMDEIIDNLKNKESNAEYTYE